MAVEMRYASRLLQSVEYRAHKIALTQNTIVHRIMVGGVEKQSNMPKDQIHTMMGGHNAIQISKQNHWEGISSGDRE